MTVSQQQQSLSESNPLADRQCASPGRLFLFIAAVNGFLAVVLGAFGAHVLKDHLSADMLAVWDTGTRYHLAHAIALLCVGVLQSLPNPAAKDSTLRAAGWLFLAGIVLFSGSLYVLAVTGIRMVGLVTPFGGLAFLAGWAALAWAFRPNGR